MKKNKTQADFHPQKVAKINNFNMSNKIEKAH